MVWTDEDSADVALAVSRMRALVDRLEADARNRRPGGRTRELLDGAMAALLALDDVYFERDDGTPVPEAWRRAKSLLRA